MEAATWYAPCLRVAFKGMVRRILMGLRKTKL